MLDEEGGRMFRWTGCNRCGNGVVRGSLHASQNYVRAPRCDHRQTDAVLRRRSVAATNTNCHVRIQSE